MEKKIGGYHVTVTNPQKLLFPGITKLEFVEYYIHIAPIIVPHIKKHPLVMHRFPQGIEQDGFYHKNIPDYFPAWIDRISIKKSKDGATTYVVANKQATLVYIANFGCITPHMWLSRVTKLDYPDLLVFDLDPGKQNFTFVCAVARQLKKHLESAGLIPFVKTTGSRGLHVTVPLLRKQNFDTVRSIAHIFAQKLVEEDPKHITLEVRLNKRRGRLFVDIARNAFGQTVAAPYAVRPHHDAPIATPLFWDELTKITSSQQFTIKNIFRRLSRIDDPWKDIYKYACNLTQLEKESNDKHGS